MSIGRAFVAVSHHVQVFTMICLIGLALAALVLTGLSAFGTIGWLEMDLRFGAFELPQAGPWVQGAITAFLVGLCFYLPSHGRIMKLETSHRDFRMSMEDVAHAYYASHAADRAGFFRMRSEFDSVRERILHLREHPDLGALEPEIMELAGQMSYQARDLAEIYSDDNIDRARSFLRQRMQEADATRNRIEAAIQTCHDFKQLLNRVELEESVVESRLQMLREELDDLMPRSARPGVAARQTRPQPVPLRPAAE